MGPAIKSIQATNDFSVVVELKQPSASLLSNITLVTLLVLPSHLDLDSVNIKPVGTGPFKIKGFQRDISADVERNNEYWGKDSGDRDLPYLDGVRWFDFTDATLAGAALRTGRVNGMDIIQTPVVDPISDTLAKEVPGIVLDRFAAGMQGPFFKNTPPLSDPKVREAIDLWLDRKEFIDVGFQGRGSFYMTGILPVEKGGQWGLPPEEIMNRPGYRMVDSSVNVVTTLEELNTKRGELRKDPQDRERARQLLAQAGIEPGKVSIEILMSRFLANRGGPSFLAQMKSLFGATWPQRLEIAGSTDVINGRFSVYFTVHSGMGLDEPSATLGNWLTTSSQGPHVGGWDYTEPGLAAIQDLFEKQEITLDPVKRRDIIWDLQRAILDWRGRIVTSMSEGFGAWRPEVKNPPLAKTAFSNVFLYERVWLAK
jgi:ABC-type transport system substrate-binding protein